MNDFIDRHEIAIEPEESMSPANESTPASEASGDYQLVQHKIPLEPPSVKPHAGPSDSDKAETNSSSDSPAGMKYPAMRMFAG